jgi:hypothetical protein
MDRARAAGPQPEKTPNVPSFVSPNLKDPASSARFAALLSLVAHVIALGALAFARKPLPPLEGTLVDFSADTLLVLDDPPPAAAPEEPVPVATTPAPQEAPPAPTPEPVPEPEEPKPQPLIEELGPPAPAPPPQETVPGALVPGPPAQGQLLEAAPTEQPVIRVLPPATSDPVASFAGVRGTPARNVVYLIDGSGAMAQALRYVRSELIRSIGRLRRDQRFTVIVYRQPVGQATATLDYFYLPRGIPTLTHATGEVKQELVGWLDNISPSGRSDPLAGLRAALALEPDVVFVLAKGIQRSVNFDAESNNQEILRELDAINPRNEAGRRTRIKTIQFLDDDPTGLMQAIAANHGDNEKSYRLVTRREVRDGAEER